MSLPLRQGNADPRHSSVMATHIWSGVLGATPLRIDLSIERLGSGPRHSQSLQEFGESHMGTVDLPAQGLPSSCSTTSGAQLEGFEAPFKFHLLLNHKENTTELSVQQEPGEFEIHCNPLGNSILQIRLQPKTPSQHEAAAQPSESERKCTLLVAPSNRTAGANSSFITNSKEPADQAGGRSTAETATLRNSHKALAPQPQSLKRNRPDSASSSGYSSSDTDESSDSDFTSDTDSDLDWDQEDLEDQDEVKKQFFQNGALQNLRQKLQPLAHDEICAWITTAQCIMPPDDRLPPRHMAKRQRRTSSTPKQDENGSDFVMVPRINTYMHLACPFFKCHPVNYRDCFKDHDVQSIEDIIRHLKHYHKLPAYCPICRKTFESAMERDVHTRKRACPTRSAGEIPIQGLTESQIKKIIRRDKYYLGERRRWMRIWKVVFPKSVAPPSPYLNGEIEQKVTLARDFWAVHGRDLLIQLLQDETIRGTEKDSIDGDMLDLISSLVLQDAVTTILDRGPHS